MKYHSSFHCTYNGQDINNLKEKYINLSKLSRHDTGGSYQGKKEHKMLKEM